MSLSEGLLSLNTASNAHIPVAAHANQDTRFASAFAVLEKAIVDRAFPGASVAVTVQGQLVVLKSFGRFTFDAGSPLVSTDTLFDLASLTKVVATTAMAMLLYQRGLLDLDLPVAAVVPEFSGEDPRRSEVTLHMLLAHSSGLPAYEKLFLHSPTRDQLLAAACTVPLSAAPGTKAVYSDIGFIVLGVALERLADETLDRLCLREIFGPLAMSRTVFNPLPALRSGIPPTQDDQTFRHRIIQGEVQDENASVLGGIAPHAGLFAPAADLAIFANALLLRGAPVLRPDTITHFTHRDSSPPGTSRALGWDTPSSPSQSGKYFSKNAYGHLGYTGTSLWIDPERQLSVTLLTNRTWPDCANKAIKEIRPRLHDSIIEALEDNR